MDSLTPDASTTPPRQAGPTTHTGAASIISTVEAGNHPVTTPPAVPRLSMSSLPSPADRRGLPSRSPDRNPSFVIRDMNPHSVGRLRRPAESDTDINPVTASIPSPFPVSPPLYARTGFTSIAPDGNNPSEVVQLVSLNPTVVVEGESGLLDELDHRFTSRWSFTHEGDVEPDPEPSEGLQPDVLRSMLRQATLEATEAQFWLTLFSREISDLTKPSTLLSTVASYRSEIDCAGDSSSVCNVVEAPHSGRAVWIRRFEGNETALHTFVSACVSYIPLRHPHVFGVADVLVDGSLCFMESMCASRPMTLKQRLQDGAAFTPEQRLLCLLGIARALWYVAANCTNEGLQYFLRAPLSLGCCIPVIAPSVDNDSNVARTSEASTTGHTPTATDTVWLWKIDMVSLLVASLSSACVGETDSCLVPTFGDVVLQVVTGCVDTSSESFDSAVRAITNAAASLSRTVSVEGTTMEMVPDAVLDALRGVCDARCGRWPPLLAESLCMLALHARRTRLPPNTDASDTLRRILNRIQVLCTRYTRPSLGASLVASKPSGVSWLL
jgi:hypothetical protein